MNDHTIVHRFRLLAVCFVLTAVAFLQQPGRLVTDTKLDLAIDPGRFLERALQMWDPNGAFGQLQNQAYGYLFPMGPFFLAGHAVSLEPWAVQRLWWAFVLSVAFLGMVKLSGLLGIATPWVRILAGIAFALSPRLITVLGPSSIEVWPTAMAPWVLVPLVLAIQRGAARRHAALSPLAVVAAGGANAAATAAVLPLGALWILVASRGPRRRALVRWWPPLVVLGTLWWLIPLMLLGRYSPPFLDYIETASVTAFATDLFDVLRGTVNWVAYIDPASVAGNNLVTTPILILNGAIVTALGLVGLARRDLPYRRFLVSGVVTGVVLVAASHDGAASGGLAPQVRDLLDGALAPLRNTHKFEVVVRIPLVMGMAHLVDVLSRTDVERESAEMPRRNLLAVGVSLLAVVSVFGASSPAWTGHLANRGSVTEIPGYWRDTADWLAQHDDGTALLLPASGFADYAWGRTGDEPLQPLAKSSWAVRNLIPLAPGGNIEMLDAISATLTTGQGGPGFYATLRRAGITHLVVRNDLDKTKDIVDPELVYATLRSTPELTSAASFGPQVGGDPYLPTRKGRGAIVNDGWQSSHPAVEIFDVPGVASATTQLAADTPVLVGDAKSLMTLDRLGVTRGTQTVLADDQPVGQTPDFYLLTDGTRRQEAGFGTVNHNRSSSLSPGDPYTVDRPVHQYDSAKIQPWLTVPRLEGASRVGASSAQSSVDVLPFTRIEQNAWAAFDNDPDTSWHASTKDAGKTSWVEIDFNRPTDLGRVDVTLGLPSSDQRRITVTTATGTSRTTAQGGTKVAFDVGTVRKLRISGVSSLDAPLAVSDVTWTGKAVARPMVMPTVPTNWGAPDRILMDTGEGYTRGCLTIDGQLRCGRDKVGAGEDGRTIDRVFTTSVTATYEPRLRATARGTASLDALVQRGRLITINSSSRVVASPQASPVMAIDGRASTGWVASPDDPTPTLTLRWVGKRSISRMQVTSSKGLPATAPRAATLTFGDGSTRDVSFVDGEATFPAVRTDSLQVRLTPGPARLSVDYRGFGQPLPVGVSEIRLPQVDLLPMVLSTTPVTLPCGTGPSVSVDGTTYRSRVTASPQASVEGADFDVRLCGVRDVELVAGKHRVTVLGTDAFRPTQLLLSHTAAPDIASFVPASSPGDDVSVRRTGQDSLVTTTHNSNPGWQATADGSELSPVVLNGWQQGWRLPAADGTEVVTRFAPDSTYRVGLLVGLIGLLGLLGLVLARWGRRVLPPGDVRAPRGAMLSVGLLLALLLAASPLCAGAAAVGLVVAEGASRTRRADLSWLAGLPIVVAGSWAALRPWAGPHTWFGDSAFPQVLVAVSLGVMISRLGSPPQVRQR
ncbi:alpha-(1-_3)-arabinofuranosyltransferase family protein [Aeromicrobium sp.]|uniref:alpha-(1->3)-arabinofuranosyltransferase domain-containing protein n=1 Tax=Aeromicrobium sp. TaxID=1871063 RepID=UPI0019ADF87B|nr:alpha-(1->3)-arabinofuranosyltransferase family protein [Aeromicrobium sp.]MBC7630266.1 DUF3367 domain-containing protein [Aeromicrobium sp.]